MNIDESTYAVVYSAIHTECGLITRISDWRIRLEQDLCLIGVAADDYDPLILHCSTCNKKMKATHIEIVAFDGPSGKRVLPRTEIGAFLHSDAKLLQLAV